MLDLVPQQLLMVGHKQILEGCIEPSHDRIGSAILLARQAIDERRVPGECDKGS